MKSYEQQNSLDEYKGAEKAPTAANDFGLGLLIVLTAILVGRVAGLPPVAPGWAVIALVASLVAGWALGQAVEGHGTEAQLYSSGAVLLALTVLGVKWPVPGALDSVESAFGGLWAVAGDFSLIGGPSPVMPWTLQAGMVAVVVVSFAASVACAWKGRASLEALYCLGIAVFVSGAMPGGFSNPGVCPLGLTMLGSYFLAGGSPATHVAAFVGARSVVFLAGPAAVGLVGTYALAVVASAIEVAIRLPHRRTLAAAPGLLAFATAPVWAGAMDAAPWWLTCVAVPLLAACAGAFLFLPGFTLAWWHGPAKAWLSRAGAGFRWLFVLPAAQTATRRPSLLMLSPADMRSGWKAWRADPRPVTGLLPASTTEATCSSSALPPPDPQALQVARPPRFARRVRAPIEVYNESPPRAPMPSSEISKVLAAFKRALNQHEVRSVRVIGYDAGPALLTVRLRHEGPDGEKELREKSGAIRNSMGLKDPVIFRIAPGEPNRINMEVVRARPQTCCARTYVAAARSESRQDDLRIAAAHDSLGRPVPWQVDKHPNAIIVGTNNTGKTTALRLLTFGLLAEDPEAAVIAIDPKHGELGPVEHVPSCSVGSTAIHLVEAVSAAVELMDERYRTLTAWLKKNPGGELNAESFRKAGGFMPRVLLVVDEVNALVSSLPPDPWEAGSPRAEEDPDNVYNQAHLLGLMDRLVCTGRGAGLRTLWGVHDPSIFRVTFLNCVQWRVCFSCPNEDAAITAVSTTDPLQLGGQAGDAISLKSGEAPSRIRTLWFSAVEGREVLSSTLMGARPEEVARQ